MFTDPHNTSEIKSQIKNFETVKDIIDLINTTYPSWIIDTFDGYSKDYPHLENNWKIICDKCNVTKQKIVVVEEIKNDKSHTLVNFLADYFTSAGFIVRTKDDVYICEKCDMVIPNEQIYKKMKSLKMDVPEVWSTKCVNC